jgi:predicted TPR repeat methyltransferase
MTGNADGSHGAAHFQRLYDASADPWGFRSSAYEAEKYDRTIAALRGRRFRRGFEAGCSIGVLTRRLAGRCDALLAVDIVETPLASARAACADLPWVRFERMDITTAWPDGRFDLMVLSEVLYFLSPAAIAQVAERATGSLAPRGMVVLVNWLGHGDDPVSGEDAARLFIVAAPLLAVTTALRQERYRIDVLERSQ